MIGVDMRTLFLSEAKMKLSALVKDINTFEEEIVITKHGRPATVLISPDEFDSWRETMGIRFDADLMVEIKKGLQDLKKKKHLCTHLKSFLNSAYRSVSNKNSG